jgi:hypothetical protein
MRVKTMRGKELDMSALIAKNPTAIAVGNANMNARGDRIGPGGKIVKRREEIAMEYHENNSQAVKTVGIKSLASELLPTPAEAVAAARQANAQPQVPVQPTAPQAHARKRKLVDQVDHDGEL